MKRVSVVYLKNKYAVHVIANKYTYRYEYDRLDDANKRAEKICKFLDLKTFSIER